MSHTHAWFATHAQVYTGAHTNHARLSEIQGCVAIPEPRRHGTGDTMEGGRMGGGFTLCNKNANPLYSPVDRLYVKQVRVPRSTCVPSIYQLAFLCPALFICSSLNAVAWMSSHIFRRTLLMTMTVLASVLRPHTALMMPRQAQRQRELWMRHCPN